MWSFKPNPPALRHAAPYAVLVSSKPHGYYTRTPQDLSWVGKKYKLIPKVRRFFCKENNCPQKISVERFGEQLPVYSRKTGRMLRLVEILGFALGEKQAPRSDNRWAWKSVLQLRGKP